jgi:hypothetical protein
MDDRLERNKRSIQKWGSKPRNKRMQLAGVSEPRNVG